MSNKKPAGLNTGASLATPPATGGAGYKPAVTTGTGLGHSSSRTGSSAHFDRPDFNATQAITNSIYQNLMGRDATPTEISKYHQMYLQYAAMHPTSMSSSSSSSSSVDTGGNVTTSQSGGTSTANNLNESDFISNLIKGTAETKDYQAATGYMDAVQSEISKARQGAF